MTPKPRKSPELGAYVKELRGDRTQRASAVAADISHGRWRQIEEGEVPPPSTLYRVGRALDATLKQFERLFELADYDETFNDWMRLAYGSAPGVPASAEMGITADPTLSSEEKAELLRYLQRIRGD